MDFNTLMSLALAERQTEANKKPELAKIYSSLKSGATDSVAFKYNNEVIYMGPEYKDWIIRLIEANGMWTDPTEERSSLFLCGGRAEAKKIGAEDYDQQFGMHGMRRLWMFVQVHFAHGASRSLSCAWSGVREWLD